MKRSQVQSITLIRVSNKGRVKQTLLMKGDDNEHALDLRIVCLDWNKQHCTLGQLPETERRVSKTPAANRACKQISQ